MVQSQDDFIQDPLHEVAEIFKQERRKARRDLAAEIVSHLGARARDYTDAKSKALDRGNAGASVMASAKAEAFRDAKALVEELAYQEPTVSWLVSDDRLSEREMETLREISSRHPEVFLLVVERTRGELRNGLHERSVLALENGIERGFGGRIAMVRDGPPAEADLQRLREKFPELSGDAP